MSLDGIRLDCNDFDQRVQSDISDVVVLVGKEFAEYVDT